MATLTMGIPSLRIRMYRKVPRRLWWAMPRDTVRLSHGRCSKVHGRCSEVHGRCSEVHGRCSEAA
eukprot:scaffold94112_cov31-Phaeocystis_antarctica.AAC.1